MKIFRPSPNRILVYYTFLKLKTGASSSFNIMPGLLSIEETGQGFFTTN